MTGYANAAFGGKRPSIMRVGKNYRSDLIDGGGYPGDYQGQTYYVNDVTGLTTNDGLSWATAFKQIDAALLASETFRHTHATNNKTMHNVIYVQGTETAYENIDQDANCFDMVGIGHRMHLGGAAGDVMVSKASYDGMAMTDLVAGWDTTINCGGGLGCNFYNMFFEASGAYWAVDLKDFLLSSFEDCGFLNSGANADGGLRATNNFAGNLVKHCIVAGDAGSPAIGMSFSGGVWNQNEIDDCTIYARTTGYTNSCYLQDASVVKNNTIYAGTTGISDTSAETTLYGLATYRNNVVFAATPFTVTNQAIYRCQSNWQSNGTTVDFYYLLAAQT